MMDAFTDSNVILIECIHPRKFTQTDYTRLQKNPDELWFENIPTLYLDDENHAEVKTIIFDVDDKMPGGVQKWG